MREAAMTLRMAVLAILLTHWAPNPGIAAADQLVYRLGSGDRIIVTVFGHEDLSGEFELDGEGRIALPLIGDVVIGQKSLRQAEAIITDRLKPDYLINPRVSIQVANYRPFYILGEVKQPGSYAFVNGMTVVQAVAIAGGYTYRARQTRVSIQRASDPARRQVPAGPDTVVLPGDILNVPERYF
jgi:protein involved in polysaccharide export with SLBB domain